LSKVISFITETDLIEKFATTRLYLNDSRNNLRIENILKPGINLKLIVQNMKLLKDLNLFVRKTNSKEFDFKFKLLRIKLLMKLSSVSKVSKTITLESKFLGLS
jgi:hypothetical protein